MQCKFLEKIIGHTINLCNFRHWKYSGNCLNVINQYYKFNAFIAILLIMSEIYLFLFRTLTLNNIFQMFIEKSQILYTH